MQGKSFDPTHVPARWQDRASGRFFDLRHAWHYRRRDGLPVGIVARYEADGEKQVLPFFRVNGRGFKAGGPKAPVLYGADRLDGAEVVFVVEGEKCASALHSLGLAAVSTQGGANKAESGDWPALAGVTRVCVLPDNDPPGERYTRDVCRALARLDPPPAVSVARLPGLPEKGDVVDWLQARLSDWNGFDSIPEDRRGELAAELLALTEQAEPPPDDWLAEPEPSPRRATGGGRYVATPTGIVALSEGRDGLQEKPLCNFTARIVEEVLRDDGQESELLLTLAGERDGRPLPPCSVSFETFASMNWSGRHWGSACIVESGNGTKDVLRCAIQTLSHAAGEVERRTVFTHTGWRQIDGEWLYLHGGGAIGRNGPVAGVQVELEGLNRYALPAPSATPAERRDAAQASFWTLDLAPLTVTLPLLACVYLAPLAQAFKVDFSIWLEAPSQAQKSSMAAVLLAHFGRDFDRTTLTAGWTDTANALESKLFSLGDALAVIDDYAPQPSASQQATLDATVSRVIRSCGNRQGRGRLRSDLTQRPEKPPRGLVIGTAEQWPHGESVNARLFGVTLNRGDVDLSALTQSQAAATSGLLARCMVDYLQGLAGRRDETIAEARATWTQYRNEAMQAGLSGRTPEQVAFLQVGADLAFAHFQRSGLTVPDFPIKETLYDLARRHARHVEAVQPAERFRNALVELLASGAAHVQPVGESGVTTHAETVLTGPRLGWKNDAKDELWLLKAPTLEAVNESLRKGESGLNIRESALWRQLQQRGWLLPGNETRTGKETARTVKVDGKSTRVLIFNWSALTA